MAKHREGLGWLISIWLTDWARRAQVAWVRSEDVRLNLGLSLVVSV